MVELANTEKPLPPLNPDFFSQPDQEEAQRHQELLELERLHELQRQEQYQNRHRQLYQQQGGIFHSNFDTESYITRRSIAGKDRMHEYILVMRGVQGLFSILMLSFSAYVVHWWTKFWQSASPLEFSFLLYLSIQTLLSLVYVVGTQQPSALLVPESFERRLRRFYHPYAVLAIDAFMVICYLAGSIGLGVFLRNRVCYGTVCSLAKACIGIGVLQCVIFSATMVNSGALSYRKWKGDRLGRDTSAQSQEDIAVYMVKSEKNGDKFLDSSRYPAV